MAEGLAGLAAAVDLPLWALSAAVLITLFAGFVKGAVGFAMPLVMISGFTAFLPPHQALAGLILPTVVTNVSQAFRQGVPAACASVVTYRRFIVATLVMLVMSAQFVDDLPQSAFLLLLGVPITAFAALQLSGVPLALRLEHQTRAEWALGVIGGLYGGISGIWGPPLLVYLLSTGVGKVETVRAQGVVFLLGAIVLFVAHLGTGLLAGPTLAFSALMVIPAMIGQQFGLYVQNRLDQSRFRHWTQILLVITGANLIRQAIAGLL